MKDSMKKLFIIVNVDWFFLSHRKELAISALDSGFDVTIVAKDTGCRKEIEKLGLRFIDLPMDRKNQKPLLDISAINFLYKLFHIVRPDIVHNVGLKVVLISGLAAMIANVKGTVSAFSGLGVTFSAEHNSKIFTRILVVILRLIHARANVKAIFQNTDDQSSFVNNRIITPAQTLLIRGSGVDLNRYVYTNDPISKRVKILLTARMIVDKGILVLVDAAKLMREEYIDKVQFILCGGLDDNPEAISEGKIKELVDGEYIVWLGHRNDVITLLKESNIAVLPSFYKEGLPKSLIEAAATGRPIVTTNSVGCRDAVIDGKTGFLIPIKNSFILAEKLKLLIDDREMRISFGKNGRALAESVFSIEDVIRSHLDIYSRISGQIR